MVSSRRRTEALRLEIAQAARPLQTRSVSEVCPFFGLFADGRLALFRWRVGRHGGDQLDFVLGVVWFAGVDGGGYGLDRVVGRDDAVRNAGCIVEELDLDGEGTQPGEFDTCPGGCGGFAGHHAKFHRVVLREEGTAGGCFGIDPGCGRREAGGG